MSQTPAGQNLETYAADQPADPQRADRITPGCALAATICPTSCDTCYPTDKSVCMRHDCRWIKPRVAICRAFRPGGPTIKYAMEGVPCTKTDRCDLKPPPVVSPATCRGRPETCGVCNPTEPLWQCDYCIGIFTDETWPGHDCADGPRGTYPGDPSSPPRGREPALPPRVGQLMIELLDVIRVRPPHDVLHLNRADDTTDLPVTNTSVLRLLRRPLDQKTTTALTAELAQYCDDYLRVARGYPVDLAMSKMLYGPPYEEERDWDAHDRDSRATKQWSLRHLIKAAVTR